MANRNILGFRPCKMLDGSSIPVLRFPIDASNGTNVFVGDVVANNAAGSVRPAAADAGVTAAGVVVALYDSVGVPIDHPSSSTGTPYLASSTAGYADVALALPDAVFRAQSLTAITAADVWGTIDHVAGTGNTTIGSSAHELNGGGGISTEGQFLILGKVDEPNNTWAADVDVYVTFHESVWAQVDTAVGV